MAEKLYVNTKATPAGSEAQYSELFVAHVNAMTAEGLHHKSDIAFELARRDTRIKELEYVLGTTIGTVEKIAFEMEAPNTFTPRFVQLCVEVRAVCRNKAQPVEQVKDPVQFTIYRHVRSYPTRAQCVAELYSLGAMMSASNDFPGDDVDTSVKISHGYKIVEEPNHG